MHLTLILRLFLCINFAASTAGAMPALKVLLGNGTLQLKPNFKILNDNAEKYNSQNLLKHPEKFEPITDNFKKGNVIWLFARVKVPINEHLTLHFASNNFVVLYMSDEHTIDIRNAGLFMPLKKIAPDDGRFNFRLQLDTSKTYTILLKVKNITGYLPNADFFLEKTDSYEKSKNENNLLAIFMQGAFAFLFFYSFLCWLATRYRPYLWLSIMILGVIFYNLAIRYFLINWFTPNAPILGWLPINIFTSTALSGFNLLIIDFLKLKQKSDKLYTYGMILTISMLVLACVTWIINGTTGNFFLSSRLYLMFSVLPITYFIYLLLNFWNKFEREERFFSFGLIAYLLAALWIFIVNIITADKFALGMSLLTQMISALVSLIFLTCINARLRQNEKHKVLYLNELNLLQKHQNEMLEAKVKTRTEELTQRNLKIETLMNELNHRVKNNLQLLYSLNSLQLPVVTDGSTRDVLKDNISRIKAMILVNDSLNPNSGYSEKLSSLLEFISDIAKHCKEMFSLQVPVEIKLDIDQELELAPKLSLSLGLIVSELITNSFKHAFKEQAHPVIYLGIYQDSAEWTVIYKDNGSGIKGTDSKSFGYTLIRDLTRQLRGGFDMFNDNGLNYIFKFPDIT